MGEDVYEIRITHHSRATHDGSADDFVRGTKAQMEDTAREWKRDAPNCQDFTALYSVRRVTEMTFDWALPRLRDGQRIYRRGWSVPATLMLGALDDGQEVIWIHVHNGFGPSIWCPSVSDLLAVDWAVDLP